MTFWLTVTGATGTRNASGKSRPAARREMAWQFSTGWQPAKRDQPAYGILSVNRSMPSDQQGLERPNAGGTITDQQGAGCRRNRGHQQADQLKDQVQIQTQIFQHAEQICMAALALNSPKYQAAQSPARSKAIDKHPQPMRQISLRVATTLRRSLPQIGRKLHIFPRAESVGFHICIRTIKIIQIVKIQSPILRREGIHPLLTSYTNSHTTTSRPHDQILLSRPT